MLFRSKRGIRLALGRRGRRGRVEPRPARERRERRARGGERGVGRGLHILAEGAELTVGVELNFAALLYARWILRGETVRYARRTSGRHYQPASIHAPARSASAVQLVCGDALDPPLAPDSFQRVASLNVMDAVQSAHQHLSVVDGLCVPGGEVVLSVTDQGKGIPQTIL